MILAVTAGSVLEAAESLGELHHAPLVLDVNSVSPATKRAAAERVGRAGGRYVEAAVMSSVPPRGLRSPMLLGGPHMRAFMARMAPFDMDLTPFSEVIGEASSVKMCRSVMVKGLEALATEAMLAARHFGVARQVRASLADTLPHEDWPARARYMIGRALVHGKRRSEEMLEVAETVRQAGVEPMLSAAIARRQSWAAEQGRALDRATLVDQPLGTLLDAVRAGSAARKPRRDDE